MNKIPDGWDYLPIQSIAKPYRGSVVDGPFGSNLKNSDYVDSGIPVLQGKNITNDKFKWSDVRYINFDKAKELERSSVRLGDILMVKIGSIGYSAIVDDLNQYDYAIIPANLLKIDIDQSKSIAKYIHYYLISNEGKCRLIKEASSTAQPALTLGKIKNFKIPIPPLPEQKRIAEILSGIDKFIEISHQKIKKLKNLRKAMLDELLSKGKDSTDFKDSKSERIPKNWEVVSLQDVCEVKGRIGYRGYTVKDLVKAGEGALTIGAKHIRNNMLFLENPEYLSWEKFYESPEIMVNEGDIIFVQRGSIGKVALIKSLEQKATINPSIVLLKNITIENSFLFYVLSSELVQKIVKKVMSSTAVPMLTQQQIKNIAIPLPPIKDQQNIAEILLGIDKTIEEAQSKIAQIDLLRKALMQDLLTGKVRVKVNL